MGAMILVPGSIMTTDVGVGSGVSVGTGVSVGRGVSVAVGVNVDVGVYVGGSRNGVLVIGRKGVGEVVALGADVTSNNGVGVIRFNVSREEHPDNPGDRTNINPSKNIRTLKAINRYIQST